MTPLINFQVMSIILPEDTHLFILSASIPLPRRTFRSTRSSSRIYTNVLIELSTATEPDWKFASPPAISFNPLLI